MKIVTILCLSLAMSLSARADKADQPPVVTHQVNSQIPPELAKSFVLDTVSVQMVVGPDGAPFELNAAAPLPDYVVRSLAEWRFEPGKRDGQAIPYTIGLNVPVRRPITRVMELSLRRRWFTASKKMKDSIAAGAALDAAGAEQLEQGLSGASLDARNTLLAYFANAKSSANAAEIRSARLKQIAWLVENAPESEILDSPLALVNTSGEPLADALGYEEVRDLWLQQLARDPANAIVLQHGTNFMRIADAEKCEALLTASKLRNAGMWLGDVYGLALLGVTALDLNTGLPAAAGDRLPDTPFARKSRATLQGGGDARVLLSAVATVTNGGRSLAKAGHLPDGYAALCQELIGWAKQIYPASAASCDTSAPPEPPQTAPLRIRIGGNVQQAKLISQPRPVYPPEAKHRRIQGTVRYDAIIGKNGEIQDLEFSRGPLIFASSGEFVGDFDGFSGEADRGIGETYGRWYQRTAVVALS